jgi:hypothetical protein
VPRIDPRLAELATPPDPGVAGEGSQFVNATLFDD